MPFADVLQSPWFAVFAVSWVMFWIGLSVVLRVRRGRPVFPKAPAGAVFVDRRASGRNLKTLRGRIGGASRCLLVAVTAQEVLVCPVFPFNLMFLPEIYGLEYRVDRASIRSVERRSGLLGETIVVSTDDLLVELRMRDGDGFLRALALPAGDLRG